MGIANSAHDCSNPPHDTDTMTNTPPRSPPLRISVREIVFAFILAKIVATVAGGLLSQHFPDSDRVLISVASTTSMVLFVLLVMLGGRQQIRDVIAATSPNYRPAGSVLRWSIVAVLAGFAFRFGISGMGLGVQWFLAPDRIAADLQDLVTVLDNPARPINALAFLLAILDAANEEIVYRRILQTYFCRRFGLAAGVLGVAVVFGAIHGSVPATIMGLWMGLLYLYCGRLWVVVVAHAVTNLAIDLMATMQHPATAQLFFVLCFASALVMLAATIYSALVLRKPLWRHGC